jgi:hypothetical protein
MQQETPQPSQPAPQVPAAPPTPSQPSVPQKDEGEDFYQPAAPAPFNSPAVAQSLPSPYSAPAHNADHPEVISWEASEYIHNDKGVMWLVGLGVVAMVFALIAIFLQAWTFLAMVIAGAIAMGVFAFRQPHVLHYTLNDVGVQIADRTYHYSDFRAFGIMQEGAFFTMTLIPVKRFAPALSVYFAEEQGEDIVDIVSAHLPMEHVEPDIIDRIMHLLRF